MHCTQTLVWIRRFPTTRRPCCSGTSLPYWGTPTVFRHTVVIDTDATNCWMEKKSTHSNALQHPPDGVLDLITTLTLRRRTIRADRPPMIAHIARTSPPGTAQLTSYRVSTVSVRLTSELAIYLVYHAGGRTINIHTNASQHPPYGILS